ncbi:penicillin-binding protein activator LpoA [Leminorella grimontii]|uniref:Penicillin-binding protein activator LpoA n=1 Tax=Leminorella grimontii TaxID=82981 RepID=A0AAV5N2W2_9GAMM|nr:penicillin-binding protein activator [Leminorella grimontii]KFC94686.1 putative lipoprotein [Leminorella grimontii ATCC 33999 = DSM 5078]GKX56428.1 penicillin-binding protein activator LpoA [Leminorella grimontii]GKX59971.1 penicillin-binding protein activator LpoA [Leminorella grimontii]VFS61285.1 Lipoprotein activator of PBP from the outer membrane A [Leminorella grimontii]
MRLLTSLRTKAAFALPMVLATTLFLAGCQITSPTNTFQGDLTQNAAYYLEKAAGSSGEAQVNWQLMAIRALIGENDTKQASAMLQQLPKTLTDAQQQERYLLSAELAAAQKKSKEMIQGLKNVNLATLSESQKTRYFRLETQVYKGRDTMAQLRAYINLEPRVTEQERQSVIDQTWDTATRITPKMMESLVIDANEETLRGWLDLLQTYQNNRRNLDMLQSSIKDWQTRYASHPAAKMPPTSLMRSLEMQKFSGSNIALLLPLSGSGGKFGPIVQDGFNTAKSLSKTSAQVKVYDTGSKPLADILTQAEQDGATMIVGPLLKKNVEEVIESGTTLGVLALNQPENIVDRPNVCYLTLSPEDEAADAARHIYAEGKKSPLIIISRGNFGERVSKAFAEQWKIQTGNTARVQFYGSLGDLKAAISQGGGMAANGQPVSLASGAASAPSASVDAIYIVSTAAEISLIKPMLDISKASKSATLYASSRSYQAGAGPDFRFEMEGLQFSEIPLLVGLSPDLAQKGGEKYGSDFSQYRLYALGADAWELASHFAEIRQMPDYQLSGATGILSADDNCVVHRKLSWIQYRMGQLTPVKSAK